MSEPALTPEREAELRNGQWSFIDSRGDELFAEIDRLRAELAESKREAAIFQATKNRNAEMLLEASAALSDRDRQLAELREAAQLVCEHGDHGAHGESTLKRGNSYSQVFWRGVETCRLDALAVLLPPIAKEDDRAAKE